MIELERKTLSTGLGIEGWGLERQGPNFRGDRGERCNNPGENVRGRDPDDGALRSDGVQVLV